MKKTIMWQYLEEIPEKAMQLIDSDQIKQFLAKFNTTDLSRILFIGSGSSKNIALVSQSLFEKEAKIPTEVYTPTQFIDKNLELYEANSVLVIAISQTGTSSGTVQSIEYAKNHGLPVLSITERPNTPVHLSGDHYLNFQCDLEDTNAKTKGYINSLILLKLLAIEMAQVRGTISNKNYDSFYQELKLSVREIPDTIQKTIFWLENNKHWVQVNNLLAIGYGTNYGSAIEGSLKLLETLGVVGCACELGEFSHGYHRTLSASSAIISIQTEEIGKSDAIITNNYISNVTNKLLIINSSDYNYSSDKTINVSNRQYSLSAINIAVVFQVMAAFLPEVIGYDPNRKLHDELTEVLKIRE